MSRVVTVQGANEKDLDLRADAVDKLLEQPTDVLKRLVELSEMPQAVKYLKSALAFAGLKMFLKSKK
jgi:hypothetical protein